jgi:hypothetical protein
MSTTPHLTQANTSSAHVTPEQATNPPAQRYEDELHTEPLSFFETAAIFILGLGVSFVIYRIAPESVFFSFVIVVLLVAYAITALRRARTKRQRSNP